MLAHCRWPLFLGLVHKWLGLLLLVSGLFSTLADTLIYDNGPFVNRPGQGPGGSDGSVVVYPMSGRDLPITQGSGYRAADDFTIPVGQTWSISRLRFFAYQPGLSAGAYFPGLTLEIWKGQPNSAGSSLLWGNTTQNVLSQSGFAGAWRYYDGSPNLNSPIKWLDASVNFTLPAGTYWLDWAVTTNALPPFGGVFQPPITIDGQRTTGNALWTSSPPNWISAVDVGLDRISASQGFPFQVYVPEPSVSGLLLAAAALSFTFLTRPRSRSGFPFRVFRVPRG